MQAADRPRPRPRLCSNRTLSLKSGGGLSLPHQLQFAHPGLSHPQISWRFIFSGFHSLTRKENPYCGLETLDDAAPASLTRVTLGFSPSHTPHFKTTTTGPSEFLLGIAHSLLPCTKLLAPWPSLHPFILFLSILLRRAFITSSWKPSCSTKLGPLLCVYTLLAPLCLFAAL